MNMVLSDVEETIYVVDVDEVTNASVVRVRLPSLLAYPRRALTRCVPSDGEEVGRHAVRAR